MLWVQICVGRPLPDAGSGKRWPTKKIEQRKIYSQLRNLPQLVFANVANHFVNCSEYFLNQEIFRYWSL